MKKFNSILLVLVMCLSMCACNSNSSANEKFIGTYEAGFNTGDEGVFYTTTVELLPDGTGTYASVATKLDSSKCTIFLKEGQTVEEGTVKWEVSDGYLIVHYSLTITLTTKILGKWSTSSEPDSYTKTYELKGSKLINVENNWDTWDKVN